MSARIPLVDYPSLRGKLHLTGIEGHIGHLSNG